MSIWYVLGGYFVLTVGELLVSPIGMALFSKLLPKKLQFSYENDPALMVKFYQNGEGDLVSINANFAVDAGLNAATEPVLVEKATDDNPYANIVVVREGDKDKLVVKKLVAALKSEDTQKFIKEKWNGAVLPVK